MDGIVIVGAGHAGAQLAASLREEGYDGPITLVSQESDLPYHKPPLSKSFMKAEDTPLQPLRAHSFFEAKGVDLMLGQKAVRIDRSERRLCFEDGTSLAYERLVLAAGTSARRLVVPGADLAGVHTLRTADDARHLRADLPPAGRVVVIGGGFIGLEAAAMLSARGLHVSVVELAPRLLGRAVSPVIAGAVARDLEGQGVDIRCGVGIDQLTGGSRVEQVHLGDGSVLAADLVIVGIGAVPETGLAETAGLACDNGIVADDLLTTSDPRIHAIGDCVSYPQAHLRRMARLESVQNATDQARALARTLTGKAAAYDALPWFWSDIGSLKLQIAGMSQDADEDIVVRRKNGDVQSVWRLSKGRLVAVETINSAAEHMLARRLISQELTPERKVMGSGDIAALKAACATTLSAVSGL